MDVIVRKTVDMLTQDSVSILTRRFVEIDEKEVQAGENHRCAYVNSTAGRLELEESEPANVVNAVLEMWGSEPILDDIQNIVEEDN